LLLFYLWKTTINILPVTAFAGSIKHLATQHAPIECIMYYY